MPKNSNFNRALFYVVWFIICAIQAWHTELLGDEAYYWLYSNKLAWGYFDHPPIIALVIKFGYLIFNNEFGVRFVGVVLGTATIFLWEKMINPKNHLLFYMTVSSIAVLHFFTGFATNDIPFLFFTTSFIWIYSKVLQSNSWFYWCLIGVNAAFLILTKYHAFVVIGLIVISNFSLFKNIKFYIAIVIGVILISPHIVWQFNNDFPSFQYHLFERSTAHYQIGFTLEYLVTQIFFLGPITGLLFYAIFFQKRILNPYEKSLKWLFIGSFLFFFIMSFKGRIEAYWTFYLLAPAIIFCYHIIENNKHYSTWIKKSFPFVITIILLARGGLIIDFSEVFPTLKKLTNKFHGKENWSKQISNIAGDNPVAFMNSYQKASLYSFYTSKDAFSLNNIMGRKNQFTIWKSELEYIGKHVVVIPNYDSNNFIKIPETTFKYQTIPNFQHFSNLRVTLVNEQNINTTDATLLIKVQINKPLDQDINLEKNPALPNYLFATFFDGNKRIFEQKLDKITNAALDKTLDLKLNTPDKKGDYQLYLSIKTGWLPAAINSKSYKVEIR